MGRWTRDRLPVVVGLVLLGGAGVWIGWAFRLPPGERSDALVFSGFVLALAGVLVELVPLLGRLARRPAGRPVDTLADLLAEAVDGQWRKEAHERRLLPDPIPIRWSLSNLEVAGPVTAAVGATGTPPAFPPLPGHARIIEADLRAGGGRTELHAVQAGLASGRIVVVGTPGAGKSGTAILLLLDALTHRNRVTDRDRAQVPVPVLLTAHGWDPTTTSVRDWLAARLAATYPVFAHRGGFAEAAALLAARDKVVLLLDGLDEMDKVLRPAALLALSDAPFRVGVLTRCREMVEAASGGWLLGAVVIHLHDVTAADATDYLQRARLGPPPAGWADLLAHLRQYPHGVLARGLSTPLTLTLLRDTYQPGDDVHDLLDPACYPTADAIEQHLIARVLPAAYAHRPGRPPLRYTHAQARQTLAFIAQQMGPERDLAWWYIPRWAPTVPRILITGLVVGLGGGLAIGITGGITGGLADGLYWLVLGLVVGAGGGLIFGLAVALAGEFAVGLVVGLIVGLGFGFGGLVSEFILELTRGGVLFGLVFGLVFGLAAGRGGGRGGGEPRQVGAASWRALLSRRILGRGLAAGLAAGLTVGFMVGMASWLTFGLTDVLTDGLTFGLVVGMVVGLTGVLIEGGTGEGRPLDPREIWRNDRNTGLYGLMVGFLVGFLVGLASGLTAGRTFGLVVGLAVGPTVGLAVGLTSSQVWPTTLAWLQLRRSGHVPAVRLMPFLEDARNRGVLRTVGAVYQFRHATLQDQLIGQATPRTRAPSGLPGAQTRWTSPR